MSNSHNLKHNPQAESSIFMSVAWPLLWALASYSQLHVWHQYLGKWGVSQTSHMQKHMRRNDLDCHCAAQSIPAFPFPVNRISIYSVTWARNLGVTLPLILFFSFTLHIHLASLVDSTFKIHSKPNHLSSPSSPSHLSPCSHFLVVSGCILIPTGFQCS